MDDGAAGIERRTLLVGGVASALVLGAGACTPGTDSSQAHQQEGPPPRTAALPRPRGSVNTPTTTPPNAGPPALLRTAGPDIRSGPRTRPAVALTFHGAGEPALTRQALAILAAEAARVTVFAVGQWLSAHPELGRAIVAGGHDLGNHTWSHQTMPRLGAAAARAEVAKGAAAVAAVPDSSPLLFRPSGTPTSTPLIREAAAASGYARCISYDVDPADYRDPGPALVVKRTLDAVRPGSIVSLHLGHPGTVTALTGILRGLRRRSLRAVTLTELLS